jgi:hypothetical protein
LRGVCYGTSSSSKYRNSTVLFQPHPQAGPYETSSPKAGIIQTIFQYMHDDSAKVSKSASAFYVIVREHPCMIATDDPYREFGFAGGFLCAEEATELHVVGISQVVSHFAMTKFKEQPFKHYFHVMPLDRVRYSLNLRS